MLLEHLFSGDPAAACSAAERLCQLARSDGRLAAALGSSPQLIGRLRDLLASSPPRAGGVGGAGGAGPSGLAAPAAAHSAHPSEGRLLMYSSYLVSLLAGRTAAVDAALLDARLLPALVAAATGSAAALGGPGSSGHPGADPGLARGALRAVAKLLEAQPACAAAQLLGCGAVPAVAGLLGAQDTGEVWG